MNRKMLFVFTLTLCLCAGSSASPVLAQIQRITGAEEALGGLTTIHPRIQYYEDGSPKEGNRTQLQSDLEGMLGDAGLKIVDAADFERLVASRSYPIALLDMEVRMSKIPDTELNIYLLSIKVRQPVFLSRKPVVKFLASSWENTDFGTARDFPYVRGAEKESLERFVQDLRGQNPQ